MSSFETLSSHKFALKDSRGRLAIVQLSPVIKHLSAKQFRTTQGMLNDLDFVISPKDQRYDSGAWLISAIDPRGKGVLTVHCLDENDNLRMLYLPNACKAQARQIAEYLGEALRTVPDDKGATLEFSDGSKFPYNPKHIEEYLSTKKVELDDGITVERFTVWMPHYVAARRDIVLK